MNIEEFLKEIEIFKDSLEIDDSESDAKDLCMARIIPYCDLQSGLDWCEEVELQLSNHKITSFSLENREPGSGKGLGNSGLVLIKFFYRESNEA